MAEEERVVLIDIQSNYEEMLTALGRVNNEITKLQDESRELNKRYKEGEISQAEYRRAIDEVNIELREQRGEQRMLQGDIRATRNAEKQHEGSLRDLRTEVNALTRQYDALSRAERESAGGQELLTKIQGLRTEIAGTTEETGRFQHNVGNYENAIVSALSANNSFVQSLLGMATAEQRATLGAEGLGESFKGAAATGKVVPGVVGSITTSVRTLTAALLANPIILILTALVALIAAVVNVIRSSEEATNSIRRIMAPVNALLSRLLDVLQAVVGVVLKAVEGFLSMAGALSRLLERLPLVGEYIKEFNDEVERSIELETKRQELEKAERGQLVENARAANQVAKLRADAEDRENFTAEQRLEFIKQANAIERANADQRLALVRERLRIAEEEASLSQNTAETEQALAQLRADVYNAETEHFNRLRELTGREVALINEISQADTKRAQDAKKTADAAVKTAQEIRANELAARRAYEDAVTNLMQEGTARTERELRLSGERQIEDLRKQLATQTNLSKQARADINASILLAEQSLVAEISRFREQTNAETIKQAAELERTNINNRLAALRADSQEALQLRLDLIEIERNTELAAAEQTGADLEAIRAKYQAQELEQRRAYEQSITNHMLAEQRARFQNEMLEAELNYQSRTAVELEQRRIELEQLQQLEGESDALYLERRKMLANEIALVERDLMEETIAIQQEQMEAISTVIGAASDLLSGLGEQNEAFAAFSKALAIFQIGIDTAKAISAGIAAAQSVPFPANIAAIATTIASILANVAKANQLISKSKQPKANFAVGGTVTGPGSGTSDSIPINVSNGESVITARATDMFTPLLSSFNQLGGGVPVTTQNASAQVQGEEMLARAFSMALRAMPAPVVSVQEINDVNGRVEVLEREITV